MQKEKEKIGGNGYGCFAGKTCENKNDKKNPQKGKQVEWSISDLEKSGLGISYYETYQKK